MPNINEHYSFDITPLPFNYGAITLYGVAFQPTSYPKADIPSHILPHVAVRNSVRSIRLSIAFTYRIPIGFFSSRY